MRNCDVRSKNRPPHVARTMAMAFLGLMASVAPSAGQTPGPCDAPSVCTIWPASQLPANPAANDPSAAELGVKFQATVNGYITAIRFYKSSANTGSHIVNLWTASGTALSSATSTNETASGWQEVALPDPVPVLANTTYVASYHTNAGFYAADLGYFATEFSNGVLKALQDAPGAGNGVFVYGASAFPTGTFQAANYWVDIVFATSLPPDTTGPQVVSSVPSNAAKNVSVNTGISATFSENIDATTLSGSTFEVRDASNALVAGQITYTSATRTAKLQPNNPLAYSTAYTATVHGGANGIKDSAGNALTNDVVWTFTTRGVPPPPPTVGPGGPILVVKSGSNPFTVYYLEILRAEGLNEFAVADISTVTATTLKSYDVVILGEQSLSDAQVSMFSDWVTGGGNLIAMRPDKKLATLLGLVDANALLPEGYIKVDTTAAAGSGIVGDTMQFHGTADVYSLNGANAVATLYSSSSVATANPAVTVRSVGSAGGQAAAFTYDLARSVVYTRQGNPALSGQETDGTAPIRSDDLFFPNYLDSSKVAIPQADEQQRLLANLIQFVNSDLKPLPRFWYFPRGLKAVVVMTGDDHSTNGTQGRFDIYNSNSTPGCDLDNWECIRATSYIYPSTPIAPQIANAYAAQGFEIAAHITTNCANWDALSLESAYANQLGSFTAAFPDLPAFATNRTHCVVWSDYDTQPQIELTHGIRLDATYYYWPPEWLSTVPGVFTGSGMAQRFAKIDGTMIDVYQAATQMTDESGQIYPSFAEALLDRALGPEGYYGSFVANMHTDLAVHPGSAAIVSSAQQRGVPVISAQQLLDWTDGRNASSFSDITWNGTALSFKVNLWSSGTRGIQAMVPTGSPAGSFVGVLKDGVQIDYTVERVKGLNYARFFVASAAYEVRYGADTLPPIISALVVAPSTNSAAITWTTNEAATTKVTYGLSPDALVFTATVAGLSTSHTITLTGLVSGTTYYYRVISTDASNNSASAPTPNGTFLTGAAVPVSLVDTTVADFAAGVRDGSLSIGQVGDGELLLLPTASAEFTGSALPAGWSVSPWTSGGSATVGGGRVTVQGALLGTDSSYNPGTVEFAASFSGHPFQSVGIGTDFNNPPWAFFTTGSGGAFYARTNNGSASVETVLPTALLSGTHRFRIDWTASSVAYWVDGALVASHAVSLSPPLRLLISDFVVDGGSVAVNWIRVGPYPTSSIFTSRVMDAQAPVSWANVAWTSSVPAGTALSLSAHFGNTPIPDSTWTGYVSLPASGTLPTSRFVQYQAAFSGDGTTTPVLENVTFTATSSGPTISVADVTVTEGDSGTAPAVFTLTLSAPMSVPVSVSYATVDGTATSGDYVTTSGTATFTPGQTSVQVSVPIKGDVIVEGNQSFFFILTNPVNAQISDPQAVCTILDNDVAQLSIGNSSIPEGNSGTSTANFTVSLNKAFETKAVTVDYATADGTATVANADYAAASGTLTFLPGQTTKTILVSVIGDTLNEANETFFVNLTNANVTVAMSRGTGTITNDDPVVSASVGVTSLTIPEGTGGTTTALIPVTLNKPSGQTVSVTYSIKDVTTDKNDYTDTGGILSFAPGETTKNISIPITTDSLNEADETFTVTVKSPVNATIVQGNVTVNQIDIPVTIQNDDPLPQISFAITSNGTINQSVVEGKSGTTQVTYTVNLSAPSGRVVKVDYATKDGTATVANGDYATSSGTLTFAVGVTSMQFKVGVKGDTTKEPDETLSVNLSNAVNATITTPTATLTIINDDK